MLGGSDVDTGVAGGDDDHDDDHGHRRRNLKSVLAEQLRTVAEDKMEVLLG